MCDSTGQDRERKKLGKLLSVKSKYKVVSKVATGETELELIHFDANRRSYPVMWTVVQRNPITCSRPCGVATEGKPTG